MNVVSDVQKICLRIDVRLFGSSLKKRSAPAVFFVEIIGISDVELSQKHC